MENYIIVKIYGTKVRLPLPRKPETGFQYMAPAWAQANPAAQTKLERAQRSYNDMSRGMGFAVAHERHRRVKNLDSERSERME